MALPGGYLRRALRPGGGVGRSAALGWLLMYSFGRVTMIRRLSQWLRRHRRFAPVGGPSVFDRSAVGRVVTRLRRDGIDATLRLPAAVTERLADAAARVAAPSAYQEGEAPADAEVDAVGADATLRMIAGSYLGGQPGYVGYRIWWLDETSAADPLSSGIRYHYDLYDYGAVVFLFFLTDVPDEAGSHSCVRGSHTRRFWRDQIRPTRHRSEAEVIAAYGAERIMTVTGPAGTVIAEDPFCFHRARPPKGRRLTVQFLYTARNFPTPSFQRVRTAGAGPPAPDTDSAASRRESRRIAST